MAALYLIPTVIAEDAQHTIPAQVREVIQKIDYFLVENVRTSRRYISSLRLGLVIEELQFEVLDKKTPDNVIRELLKPLKAGKNVGVLSESGCPGVADPGAASVKVAQAMGHQVVPLAGPSSILMALMGSGFNGQRFCFHGYLPIDKKKLETILKELEKESAKKNLTQIFIETPYRNNQLLASISKHCQNRTMLCIAKDVTGKSEFIVTKSVADWRKKMPELHKVPTVFALYSGS